MVMQIHRPDIVITLPEFDPARALSQADRIARTRRVEDEEEQRGAVQRAHPQQDEARETYERVAEPSLPPQPALLAAQIMSSPVRTLEIGARPEQAWRLIREHRLRHLPLTSAQGRISGIVSERDLLRHAAEPGRRRRSLSELASREVLTATADTEIRVIAAIMLERRVGCVPIVDADAVPIGIVTRADILRALLRRAPLELWV